MDFGFQVTGLLGLLGLVLMVWALLEVAQSRTGGLGKALWIVFLLAAPVVGWLVWFFLGPRSADGRGDRGWRRHSYRRRHGY